jgi:5-methylcytosine-specific restriction endonuclease McrA
MGQTSAWKPPPGWKRIRERVFARDGRGCWACGAYANSVDHIVAVALGGTLDLSNLRPACSHHNSSAGASLGNRMRPPRPLTARQRQAIAWKSSRRW